MEEDGVGGAPPAGASSAPEQRVVVVAVDESEESMYALGWCLRNIVSGHARGHTVVLLYARPPPPICLDGVASRERHGSFDVEADFVPNLESPEAGYPVPVDVINTTEDYSKYLADSVVERATKACKGYNNIKVETKVAVGDARDVICKTVEKAGADLLVMGSHGYGFIKRAFLGSVSDYCAHNAKCPVLIVKRS